jgi:hypothetical protein
LQTWHQLPHLLADPSAIFPSVRGDSTIVVVIAVLDRDGNPIIAPITPSSNGKENAVLSLYGKSGSHQLSGHEWVASQIASARKEGYRVYEKSGSVDSKPKPESADAISWSPDLIPVDRSTEPKRQILKIREKSTKS